MPEERRQKELTEAAEHAARRLELYKAKTYGPKQTSPGRLRELQREADRAKLALHRGRNDG